MVKVIIDNQQVDVRSGSTILDAARVIGVSIPTLCFFEGQKANTSCMVCLVKIKSQNKLVPACATPVFENMDVESNTEEVYQARKTALELLLSEHGGECFAPCHNACPAGMDIPLAIRQIEDGAFEEAIRTIKRDIALPAVMGRVCTAPCEKGCHRSGYDEAVSIAQLERYIADRDLVLPSPYLPPCKPSRSKHIAIVGAGPVGLTAAYHLRLEGYECTVFDRHNDVGGTLRREISKRILPYSVLRKEVSLIEKIGVRFHLGVKVGDWISLDDLRKDYDAVLLACGDVQVKNETWLSSIATTEGIKADINTFKTEIPGVFAAGSVISPEKLIVRALAQGKYAAHSIKQYVSGETVTGPVKMYAVRLGKMTHDDLQLFLNVKGLSRRTEPSRGECEGFLEKEAKEEALRCNHCGCDSVDRCKLKYYAELFRAQTARFRGKRRLSSPVYQHPDIVYDSGKCILCGICVQITRDSFEKLGLAFTGRGYDVKIAVPFQKSLHEGLTHTARECVMACPSGALEFRMGIRERKMSAIDSG